MRKVTKSVLLCLVLAVVLGLILKPENVTAAETAKEIVAKAVEELKSAETISYSVASEMNYIEGDGNEQYYSYESIGVSSDKIQYEMLFDETKFGMSESIVYLTGDKSYYRYGGTTEFISYENYNYEEDRATEKIRIEYNLSHLKKVKISKTSKKYYTITAKSNWKDAEYSKITMIISKKTGRLVKIKYTLAKGRKEHYRDSESEFVVSGGSEIISNINYGEMALKLPDDLDKAVTSTEEIDYAAIFPSWDPDSESLKELIAFVNDATDVTSENYIMYSDRIAVFDMDGTILCEKAPVYVDYCLTMYRVLDDPTYDATDEERDAMQQVRDHAYTEGTTFHPEGITKDDLVASAFAGMTAEEFRKYVVDFADNTDAVGFSGMTYGQSFYKPMIEVIDYLRANGFDVWMVSACEREVVRALVERFGIPYDHVIATDVPYVASGNNGKAADDYNMSKDEEMLLGAPLDEVECGKSGKPAAIAREIGKRPVLAFGNSSGDYSMLNYAEGNPNYTGMGFFIVCDDTVREYGSDEKAAEFYDKVEKEGWTAISMANDWKTIYGDGVQKTELPGTAESVKEAA